MSRHDRDRWDKKWSDTGDLYLPHALLLDNEAHLAGGLALDLACGRGQNALWLGLHGYRVLAVDISQVALAAARARSVAMGLAEQVLFTAVDLDDWAPPRATFDLIAVFRFLDRRLFSPIRHGLRSGGLICYSTRHLGALSRYPQANQDYLLHTGELLSAFSGWHVLHYEEGAIDAQLIARKPNAAAR